MVKIARYNLNKTVQKGQKKRKSLKKQELFWQKKKGKSGKKHAHFAYYAKQRNVTPFCAHRTLYTCRGNQ